ncbi:hypothetical protein M0D21_09580 [Aquimarina sp. D1M17]|uniref:hypothetical protein n=1 Tax=Aquimarina acroporae TaxID=2937283 RepID=UPI0020C14318|nr:hypothetical protein [Aquimarina acroporae]MCK8521821.1 hypothetical protein [Aquimarina acroporae]
MYLKYIAFLLLSTSIAFGQERDKEEVLITDQDKFITLSQVNAISPQENTNLSAAVNSGNSIFIQQIGTNNQVFSSITAQSSDIKIFQNGSENRVEIDETALETNKLITQTGNNNVVTDFSFDPTISTNLELIQEGNNLIFERFGNNELTNSLKFKMAGDARTIIIRSF